MTYNFDRSAHPLPDHIPTPEEWQRSRTPDAPDAIYDALARYGWYLGALELPVTPLGGQPPHREFWRFDDNQSAGYHTRRGVSRFSEAEQPHGAYPWSR